MASFLAWVGVGVKRRLRAGSPISNGRSRRARFKRNQPLHPRTLSIISRALFSALGRALVVVLAARCSSHLANFFVLGEALGRGTLPRFRWRVGVMGGFRNIWSKRKKLGARPPHCVRFDSVTGIRGSHRRLAGTVLLPCFVFFSDGKLIVALSLATVFAATVLRCCNLG